MFHGLPALQYLQDTYLGYLFWVEPVNPAVVNSMLPSEILPTSVFSSPEMAFKTALLPAPRHPGE